MPLVSIIVPVYKAEQWLHFCVDSILAQTMPNFELLLVDDGSPDKSGEICDEYAKQDSRIRVFHKENGGEVSARYEGWMNMQGEYLMFVDADDELPIDVLETLLVFMKDDVNIVCGEMISFEATETPNIEYNDNLNVKIVSNIEYCRNIFQGKGPLAVWGKLYRRKVVTYDVFDIPREIKKGPDAIGSARIAFNNDKDVVFVDKVIYCYRQHPESCIHTFITTPDYEQKFYDNLWLSVPEKFKDEYINYLIGYKLWTFDSHFGHSIDRPSWIGSDFYNRLLKEIDEYNYKGQLIARLLLTITSKPIRAILIFVRKISNILVRLRNKLLRIWKVH